MVYIDQLKGKSDALCPLGKMAVRHPSIAVLLSRGNLNLDLKQGRLNKLIDSFASSRGGRGFGSQFPSNILA